MDGSGRRKISRIWLKTHVSAVQGSALVIRTPFMSNLQNLKVFFKSAKSSGHQIMVYNAI